MPSCRCAIAAQPTPANWLKFAESGCGRAKLRTGICQDNFRRYFSCLSSTTITSMGLSPAFTSACIVLGGFNGNHSQKNE
jgi:hypothetical protein